MPANELSMSFDRFLYLYVTVYAPVPRSDALTFKIRVLVLYSFAVGRLIVTDGAL